MTCLCLGAHTTSILPCYYIREKTLSWRFLLKRPVEGVGGGGGGSVRVGLYLDADGWI